jgi:hypothetical protein
MDDNFFSYEPITESEAQNRRYKLIKNGIYDAKINKVIRRKTKANNPMIELYLEIYTQDEESVYLKDFLLYQENMAWKLRHAIESAGLIDVYENKMFLPEMLENKFVRINIGTQEGKEIPEDKLNGKEKGSLYPNKNVVVDYLKNEKYNKKMINSNDEFSDDIPF